MRQLTFLLSLFLLACSGIIYAAAELHNQGFDWADRVYAMAPDLCREPFYLGAVTGAMVAAYLVLQHVES